MPRKDALSARSRPSSTTKIVVGAFVAALGLTALADREAQAGNDPRDHAGLSRHGDAGELRVLDWTLWHVSKYYVEPDRVDPAAMTLAGIEALEQEIPEVLVEPAKGGRITVRVGTRDKEFDAKVDALWAVAPHVRDVFAFVETEAQLDDERKREIEYAIVEAVLGTLDPHTNLLRPEAFSDMKASTTGHFGGLGIEVGNREGEITVIRVLDGNPAEAAGMLAGDRIVRIDDESTVTMILDEAVSRMRGAPGTTVDIYVRREGLERPKRISITRAIIKLDSVTGDLLPGTDAQGKPAQIGLIQIPRNFSQGTGRELRAKLKEFEEAGVGGVVLDMRSNPGGLLTAAVEVADAFLSSGTIVSTVGAASPRDENRADSRYDFPDVPVVVLVDQGSASATEIVAGALRNLDRAVIVGRRTFGKGSVQVLHDRKVGDDELALKLTIAQYLTPGDVSIQSVGVSPDLETIPVFITDDYVAYHGRQRFDRVREESLALHLKHGTAKAQESVAGPLHYLQQGSVGAKDTEGKSIGVSEKVNERAKMLLRDPEVRIARDLALWAPSSKREEILANINDFTKAQTGIEDGRIAQSLSKTGVDWSLGPKPSDGQGAKLRLSVTTDKKNDTIVGGEVGMLTVTVENVGDAPAYRVRAMSDSDYSYFDERELLFGKLEPGAKKKASVKLTVSEHELSRTDRLDLHVVDAHASKLAEGSKSHIDVSARGLTRPQFAYGYQIVDDPAAGKNVVGNGDGQLQVGERVKVRVWAENTGDGDALDTWIHIRNFEGDAIFLHDGRQKLGKLAVGKSGSAELELEVKRQPEDGEARIQLTVSDNKIGEYVLDRLDLPVAHGGPTINGGPSKVTLAADTLLRSAPDSNAHVIARVSAKSSFKASGETGDYTRVQLGKGRIAFVKTDAVEQGGGAKAKYKDEYLVTPPDVRLKNPQTRVDGESIDLSGVAVDPHGVRDLYITVQNPSRNLFGAAEKVFYQAAKDPSGEQLSFEANVPLTPGNNLIEIIARQDEDVKTIHRMWVLRTSGLAEARAASGSYKNDGSLAVDTFNGPGGR